MSSMPLDMRCLLRHATQRYHDRLDASLVLAPLTRPDVTLQQYQTATIALLRTYAQVDACLLLTPSADCVTNFGTLGAYTPRSVAIQQDLRAMGIESDSTKPQGSVELELPVDFPTYLGMRYVIEGSQFGNRIIGRNLHAVFGTAAVKICTAWQPNAKTDDGWVSVMAALANLTTRREIASALRGARQTFRHFVDNLCRA